MLSCKVGELTKDWHSAVDVPSGVARVVHPLDVAFDLRRKPIRADAVNGGRLDIVLFEHDNLHSITPKGSSSSAQAAPLCSSNRPYPQHLRQSPKVRTHNVEGNRTTMLFRGTKSGIRRAGQPWKAA